MNNYIVTVELTNGNTHKTKVQSIETDFYKTIENLKEGMRQDHPTGWVRFGTNTYAAKDISMFRIKQVGIFRYYVLGM